MPLPNPRKGENRNDFVARCMRFFDEEKSDLPRDRQLAACFNQYKTAKKKKTKARKKPQNLAQELRKLAEHYHSKYRM